MGPWDITAKLLNQHLGDYAWCCFSMHLRQIQRKNTATFCNMFLSFSLGSPSPEVALSCTYVHQCLLSILPYPNGALGPSLVRSPKTFCRSFHLLWRARMMWDIRCQPKWPPRIRFLFHQCRNVGCWLCFAGAISACFEIESVFLRLETCKTIQITCPTSTGVEFLSSTVNLSGHWTKPLPFDSRYRYFEIHGFCLVPDRRVKALFVATCLLCSTCFSQKEDSSFWKQYNYQYWFLILKQWYYLEKYSPPSLNSLLLFLGG